MPRENAAAKARRLLAEGRITVRSVDGTQIAAACRGDSARTYDVGYDARDGRWYCTCAAMGRCSHQIALQLCTLEPEHGRNP